MPICPVLVEFTGFGTFRDKLQLGAVQAMSGLKQWLLPLLALGWCTAAWGATLSDPTLPPPAWLAAQSTAPGAAAPVEQNVSPGLRLTLVGPSRKFALINGQVVKPGDVYNGSRVLAIKSGKVVVEDASKSLNLAPGVEKKVITPAPR